MNALPNLAGIATAKLVEQIGGGSFKASYINWSRTLEMLRQHAPGWMPELVMTPDSTVLHASPVGAFLLIRFRHIDGTTTTEVPQAVMDTHNKAIPFDRITARDVTDTHRRGVCMAAAFTFGLAYELWAKIPLESGFAEPEIESVSAEQAATLHDWLADTGADEAGFLAYFGAASVDAFPADKFAAAVKMLEAKKAKAA